MLPVDAIERQKLARKILEVAEALRPNENLSSRQGFIIDGYDTDMVAYHVAQLHIRGFLKAVDMTGIDGLVSHRVIGLTPLGHTKLGQYRKRAWLGYLRAWGWKVLVLLAALIGAVYKDPVLEWLKAVLPFAKR